jgi:hypothetical protein
VVFIEVHMGVTGTRTWMDLGWKGVSSRAALPSSNSTGESQACCSPSSSTLLCCIWPARLAVLPRRLRLRTPGGDAYGWNDNADDEDDTAESVAEGGESGEKALRSPGEAECSRLTLWLLLLLRIVDTLLTEGEPNGDESEVRGADSCRRVGRCTNGALSVDACPLASPPPPPPPLVDSGSMHGEASRSADMSSTGARIDDVTGETLAGGVASAKASADCRRECAR